MNQFQAWATGTFMPAHPGKVIELLIPLGSNCHTDNLADATMFDGITPLIVEGTGASLTSDTQIVFFGGAGLDQSGAGVASHCAAIQTASKGATQVTAVTAGQANRVTVGNWAVVMGDDMQGVLNANFGYPPNPAFHTYVQIASANTGTGVITFSGQSLNDDMKSTWPQISSDPGSASICPLPANWNVEQEYRGFTWKNGASFATNMNGRKITWHNINCVNSPPNPSQNFEAHLIGDSCVFDLEVDKIIDLLEIQGGHYGSIIYQSSSVRSSTVNGTTIDNALNGTPLNFVGTNLTIPNLFLGTTAYGATNSFVCNTCNVTTSFQGVGPSDNGLGVGVQNNWSMSGGVITVPFGGTVSGAVSNGSGGTRLTVDTTTGMVNGKTLQIQNVAGINGGIYVGAGVPRVVTVIDATHVDIPDAFSGTYSGGGEVWPGNLWGIYVPGTNVHWHGHTGFEGNIFINDVAYDSPTNTIKITTNLAGGFPTVPLDGGGLLRVDTHPAPHFTCSCTGDPQLVSMSHAPAAAPVFSYQTFTYTGSIGTAVQPVFDVLGNITSISLNMTQAYSGAGSPFFHLSEFDNWHYTTASGGATAATYAGFVNAKIAGNRVITAAGVTGTQSGDSGLALADPTSNIFGDVSHSGPQYSVDTSASCPGASCPSVTITIQADQGLQ